MTTIASSPHRRALAATTAAVAALTAVTALVALVSGAAGCADDGAGPPTDLGAVDRGPIGQDGRLPDLPRRDSSGLFDALADAPAAKDAPPSPCPPLMALVGGATPFCIDRYEGALEERQPSGAWVPASPYLVVGTRQVRAVVAQGKVPQGYISGDEAAKACQAAGKRLCGSGEWLTACRGLTSLIWPYGNSHVAGACNDDYQGHPVVKYFGTGTGIWDAVHMNDPGINQQPGTVAAGGAHAACVSHWGVFDLHGNLHEWVAEAAGTFRGGFYADASINGSGCLYQTTAHAFGYHDYSTGFRCCAAPTGAP